MKLVKLPGDRYLNPEKIVHVEPRYKGDGTDTIVGYRFILDGGADLTLKGTPGGIAGLTAWLDDLCAGE